MPRKSKKNKVFIGQFFWLFVGLVPLIYSAYKEKEKRLEHRSELFYSLTEGKIISDYFKEASYNKFTDISCPNYLPHGV